jgi:hypothetical protein
MQHISDHSDGQPFFSLSSAEPFNHGRFSRGSDNTIPQSPSLKKRRRNPTIQAGRLVIATAAQNDHRARTMMSKHDRPILGCRQSTAYHFATLQRPAPIFPELVEGQV